MQNLENIQRIYIENGLFFFFRDGDTHVNLYKCMFFGGRKKTIVEQCLKTTSFRRGFSITVNISNLLKIVVYFLEEPFLDMY